MTYTQAIEYLYHSQPVFHLQGASAYKPGLDNMLQMMEALGNPHLKFKTIHVAGTNGKGSTAHMLAAMLGSAGLRVGLYTSPHLVDFTERIRVNGRQMPRDRVAEFVEENMPLLEQLKPSFFETTTAIAFSYFAYKRVDIAVVEVGLGGRLDATNIITPELSIITGIGLDHTDLLGDTIEKIAAEKAGIIKHGVPVVVGEVETSVLEVFRQKAQQEHTDHFSVSQMPDEVTEAVNNWHIVCQLKGSYQDANIRTVLLAAYVLDHFCNIHIFSEKLAVSALAKVCDMTGLHGRWQVLDDSPLLICDIAHNPQGIKQVVSQLADEYMRLVRQWMCRPLDGTVPQRQPRMHIVIGIVRDKDIDTMLRLLPVHSADYYFTQASTPRALPADELCQRATALGYNGQAYPTVSAALRQALSDSRNDDVVLVTGSNYVVGDALRYWKRRTANL